MLTPFRAAIIGGGSIADKNHIPALKQLAPLVEVVAVCSRDVGKARAMADAHGIPHAFADPAVMYAECQPNVVINCTPNNLHYSLTMQALANNCHVLCEKPPAITAREAREMADVATQKGLTLAYNFQRRQSAQWRLMLRCRDEGQLGEVYHIKAHYLRRRGIPGWGSFTNKAIQGGGALMDLGVHVLDLALDVLNYPPPDKVLGNTYNFIGKTESKGLKGNWNPETFSVEDACMAHISFSTNASIALSASFALNMEVEETVNLEVFGSKGGATLYPFNLHTAVAGELADIRFPFLEELDNQLANTTAFLDACQGKPTTICTAEQGAVLMDIVERIYLS